MSKTIILTLIIGLFSLSSAHAEIPCLTRPQYLDYIVSNRDPNRPAIYRGFAKNLENLDEDYILVFYFGDSERESARFIDGCLIEVYEPTSDIMVEAFGSKALIEMDEALRVYRESKK